jgi:hypothetical protein
MVCVTTEGKALSHRLARQMDEAAKKSIKVGDKAEEKL